MNRIKMSMSLILLCMISLVIVPITAEANPISLKAKPDKPAQSKIFEEGPPIPETNTNWIPQGLTYTHNWLLISYYHLSGKKTTDSMVAVVDKENGQLVKKVKLLDKDGKPHKGHVGGITVSGKYLWVASTTKVIEKKKTKNYLLRYKIDELINNTEIRAQDIFTMPNKVSYVTYRVKRYYPWVGTPQLCIGEYEEKGNGKLYCYNLDSNEDLIRDKKKKFKANSITETPSHVQGVEFVGPNEQNLTILYSRSFGREKNSKLDVYRGFDLKDPVKSLTLYSMSEGIVNVNNQLYVNYESGAKKYRDKGIKITTTLYYGDINEIIK